ncbi:MAG TPA: hypothetical protein VFO65_07765, partial [Acidimicrobiales bacterium]|nr:hypothetical protein [Acidimicrobiales bacterium]
MPDLVRPGDILPSAHVRPLGGGPPVRLGPNRARAQVLVVTHAERCDGCLGYLRSWSGVHDTVRAEKADVVALVGRGWSGRAADLPVPAVVAERGLADALSVAGTPVVAVADRFGQLFERIDAGDDHAFPDHAEVFARLVGI